MKKVKGFLFIVFAALACLSFTFAACFSPDAGLVDENKHTHAYDRQIAEQKYLASAATCTQAATYYYSCECGEAGTRTFEHGQALGHDVQDVEWKSDETSHWKVCERCGERVEKNVHSGGTATCTHKAVCEVCGAEYGNSKAHVFDRQVTDEKYLASAATCTDAATYYYSCECGAVGTEVFGYGEPLGHDTEGQPWLYDGLSHWKVCTVCGVQVEKGAHTGGTATAESGPVCEVCGEEYGSVAHTHVYDQQVVEQKYLASAATCTQAATYYYSCECGEAGTEVFEYGELKAHVFDKQVTEGKFLATAATCTDAATYYYSCECGAVGTEVFEYGKPLGHNMTAHEEVEATCTTAGNTAYWSCDRCGKYFADEEGLDEIERGSWFVPALGHDTENAEWQSDETSHWKVCAVCGEKVDEETHRGGSVTCTQKAVCEICGKEYGETLPHSFNQRVTKEDYLASAATCTDAATYYYSCECGEKGTNTFVYGKPLGHDTESAEWQSDGTSHWKECARCHKTVEKAEHTGGEATCSSKAECAVCGAEYGQLKAHVFDRQVVDENYIATRATCTQAATYFYSCECGEKGTKTFTYGDPLNHNFEEKIVEPTCTEDGYSFNRCSRCGLEENRQTKLATGHNYDQENVSCVEDIYCKDCGELVSVAKGHNYVESLTEYDCIEGQSATYRCDVCGDEYTELLQEGKGHQVEKWTTEETQVSGCEYSSVTSGICTVCGETVTNDPVTVYRHKYVKTVGMAATCQAGGEYIYTCSVCKDSYTEVYSDPEAHVWDEGTTDGNITTYTCTLCGATKKAISADKQTSATVSGEDLSATGELELQNATISMDKATLDQLSSHGNLTIAADTLEESEVSEAVGGLSDEDKQLLGESPVYNFTVNEGAVTEFEGFVTVRIPYEDGEDGVDNIVVWYIQVNEDGSGNELVKINATWEDGYAVFTTQHFSYYTVSRLTAEERCAVYGHTFGPDTVVEATCVTAGYTRHTCMICGETEEYDRTDPTGHNYVLNQELSYAAECTVNGREVYTCENCGNSYTKVIKATGHNYVEVERAEATCTQAGYILYRCNNGDCGAEYRTVIAKLAHSYEEEVVKPTCTADGYTRHTCTACGYTYISDIVSALDHSYQYSVITADCVHGGYSEAVCEVCGHSYIFDETEALGHDWNRPQPDCGNGQYCLRCGAQGLPATGEHQWSSDGYCEVCNQLCQHDYPEYFFNNDATCTDNGTESAYCSICGHEDTQPIGGEPIGHRFVETRVEPTCIKNGYVMHVCSVCGLEEKTEILPATGHNYVNGTCTVCGSTQSDFESKYANMIESLLDGSYEIKLDGASYSVDYEYENGHSYIMNEISVGEGSIFLSRDGIDFYVFGDVVSTPSEENPDIPVQYARIRLVTRDGIVYGDQCSVVNGVERNHNYIRMTIDDMLAMAAGPVPTKLLSVSGITSFIGWYEDSLKPVLLTLREQNEVAVHEVLARYIEKYAKIVETQEGSSIALNATELKALWAEIEQKPVSEVIDYLNGEGSWVTLRDFVKDNLGKNVSEAVDMLIGYCEDYGTDIQDIYSAVEDLIYLINESRVDIEEAVAANGDITVEQLIRNLVGMPEDFDLVGFVDNTIELLETSTVLEAINEMSGQDVTPVFDVVGKIINALDDGFSLTTSTDKSGVVTSMEAVFDNWVVSEIQGSYTIEMNGILTLVPDAEMSKENDYLIDIIEGYREEVVIREELVTGGEVTVVDGVAYYLDTVRFSEHEDFVSEEIYNGVRVGKYYAESMYAQYLVAMDMSSALTIVPDCGDWIRVSYNGMNCDAPTYRESKYVYRDINSGKIVGEELISRIPKDTTSMLASCTFMYNTESGECELNNYSSKHRYELVDRTTSEECGGLNTETYRCSECGDTYTNYYSTPHELYYEFALDEGADSCEDGFTVYSRCSKCGELISTEHDFGHRLFDEDFTTETACGETVISWRHCACGAESYVDVKSSCNFVEERYDIESDYVSPWGSSYGCKYTCPDCGNSYTEEHVYKVEGCYVTNVATYKFSWTDLVIEIERDGGTQHDRVPAPPQSEEYADSDGNDVSITTDESVCSKCGEKLVSTQKTVTTPDGVVIVDSNSTKVTDGDGNTLSENVNERCYYENGRQKSEYSYSLENGNEYWMRTEYEYDGCTVHIRETNSDGAENNYTEEAHEYEYVYKLLGESCEDGVRKTQVCKYCGNVNYQEVIYHHDKVDHSFIIETGCGKLEVRYLSCPCGEQGEISAYGTCSFERSREDMEDDPEVDFDAYREVYTCKDCAFSYSVEYYAVQEGCNLKVYARYDFGDAHAPVVGLDRTQENHSFQDNPVQTEEYTDEYGNTVMAEIHNRVCSVCGRQITERTERVVTPDGTEIRYYDSNTVTNADGSLVSENIDENCYYDDGRQKSEYSYSLENGNENWMRTEYEYDGCTVHIRETNSDGAENNYTEEAHEYEYSYELLGESCEDGVRRTQVCKRCGVQGDSEVIYEHDTISNRLTVDTACGTLKIDYNSCPCGENSWVNVNGNCSFYGEKEDMEDDPDVQYDAYRGVYTCDKCGYSYTVEYYGEQEGCIVEVYRRYVFEGIDGAITVHNTTEEVHSFVYDPENVNEYVDEEGNTVRSEVVGYTCERCGERRVETTERVTTPGGVEIRNYREETRTDISGAVIRRDVRETCHYENGRLKSEYSYDLDDSGNEFWTRYEYEYDGCTVHIRETNSDGYDYSSTDEAHEYEYVYELLGESCEDGVRRTEVCKYCGEQFASEVIYEHEQVLHSFTVDTGCGKLTVDDDSCPCGEASWIKVYGDCSFYSENEDMEDNPAVEYDAYREVYTCAECGYSYTIEYYAVKEGCDVKVYARYNFGDAYEEFVRVNNIYEDHNYAENTENTVYYTDETTGYIVEETTIRNACADCGFGESSIARAVYYPDGTIYESSKEATYTLSEETWQRTTEISRYDIYGRTIYNYNEQADSYGNNYWSQQEYSYDQNCQGTYVYTDINGSSSSGNNGVCHSFVWVYELAEGSESCEDGVTRLNVCKSCGYIDSTEVIYWHNNTTSEYVTLTNCGIERVYVDSCVCGENVNIRAEGSCEMNEERTDMGEGVEGYANYRMRYYCQNCGFEYSELHEYVAAENCAVVEVITIECGSLPEINNVFSHTYAESHDLQEDNTQKSVEDENGNTVTTVHYTSSCSKCGYKSESTEITVTSPDGLTLSRNYESYENDELVSWWQDDYTYDGCIATIVRTYSDDSTETRTEELHKYVTECTLKDGATSCEDGVVVREYCSACGVVFNEYEVNYHEKYTVYHPIETHCGEMTVEESRCACGENVNVYVSGNCQLEDIYEDLEDTVPGYDNHIIRTVCQVTDCDFEYVREITYYVENCAIYERTVYTCVQLPEFNLERVVLVDGNYHSFEATTQSADGTDEEGNATHTETYTEECTVCGLINTTVRTYTYDAEGRTIKEVVEHNFNGDVSGEEHEYAYDGNGNRIYVMTVHTSNGEVVNWHSEEYSYSEENMLLSSVTTSGTVLDVADTRDSYEYDEQGRTISHRVDDFISGYWSQEDYRYEECFDYCTYTDSNGENYEKVTSTHHQYETVLEPTCTQFGEKICQVCGATQSIAPNGHNYYQDSQTNQYVCSDCGLHSDKEINGSIMLEDMTVAEQTYYTVGYYNRDNIQNVLVSVWAYVDGEAVCWLEDVEITVEDSLVTFDKAQTQTALEAAGYAADCDIQVRFVGEDLAFEIVLD